MNNIYKFLKRYLVVIMILITVSIVLSMSYSNFIVTSENHKVAEMYIGTLKYSMSIDGTNTNTLSVPNGETIIDVTINNENLIDTYYKLIYENNSNISIKYYESTKDTNDNVTNYSSPNDKLLNSGTNNIKLKVVNNSASLQTIIFKVIGGFATNALDDVTVPSGYTTINIIETASTNTYFCTTTDTLTQGVNYINGQYTYAYKQEGIYALSDLGWRNITSDGWGVQLTDKTSRNAVTSKVCTYINNKPIASMSYMFYSSKATTLDVSNFDTSNVTNMSNMFRISQARTLDVSNFNTSNVTNISYMFYSSKATTLDVSNFDTSKVTNISYMFYGSQATTLDVSNFDTSNVTNMSNMFRYSRATTLDVSNFDTSKVTDMSQMFSESQATTLDISNFDTSNVTNMRAMFDGSKVTTLDVSNFDTSNVTNMSGMFGNASNLKTIYASSKFKTDKVTDSTNMFLNSTNLVGGAGTTYNSSYVDKTYARIDGGTSNPGYFTDVVDKDIPEPNSFATDSWKTIAKAARTNNTSKYNVGDTRTIDMGTYGTHTLRLANKSTPSECSTAGFSQSACGFVLEFVDIITRYNMNPKGEYNGTQYEYGWNKDGWPVSSMYAFVNNDIYNTLPSDLRSVIIDTIVVSGHGSEDTANFTSTDKLYLLAPNEIYSDGYLSVTDTAKELTRTLDYYTAQGVTGSNYSGAIKKSGTSAYYWWLRSANPTGHIGFCSVQKSGNLSTDMAYLKDGVSPAFRLG
mgnify:CR=1 FL=1